MQIRRSCSQRRVRLVWPRCARWRQQTLAARIALGTNEWAIQLGAYARRPMGRATHLIRSSLSPCVIHYTPLASYVCCTQSNPHLWTDVWTLKLAPCSHCAYVYFMRIGVNCANFITWPWTNRVCDRLENHKSRENNETAFPNFFHGFFLSFNNQEIILSLLFLICTKQNYSHFCLVTQLININNKNNSIESLTYTYEPCNR